MPHSAQAGAARAEAFFGRIIELAAQGGKDALDMIRAVAEAARDDVKRFVPDVMRQAASDEARRREDSL